MSALPYYTLAFLSYASNYGRIPVTTSFFLYYGKNYAHYAFLAFLLRVSPLLVPVTSTRHSLKIKYGFGTIYYALLRFVLSFSDQLTAILRDITLFEIE